MALTTPLRRAAAWGLLRSGLLGLHRRRREHGRAILLLYHRVNDDDDPFFPALPLRSFRAQLDHLARSYRIEPLETVLDWVASGARGPARVALTIDDGYPDSVECVLPELERRGLPATLLVSTGPPETGAPLWTDRTRFLFKHTEKTSLELPGLGLPRLPLDTRPGRLRSLDLLLARMKGMAPEPLDELLRELEEALGPAGAGPRVLSWDHARRLTAGGMRIGAHTHRHYILSRLDEGRLREEISTSVRLIEERLGTRVTSFAYPNGTDGDYDERPAAVLRELGIGFSLTARDGFVRPGFDPWALPRLFTTEQFLPLFALRVAGLRERRELGS
jgi:peptidoglycan/xylan/chitin deacetylase (PgdA/CDA1 family)